MTEGRYFYTVSGSIRDDLAHNLDDAWNYLMSALSEISNPEHLHIDIQGPNKNSVISCK